MSLGTKIILILMSVLVVHAVFNYGVKKLVEQPAYSRTENEIIQRELAWFLSTLNREAKEIELFCENLATHKGMFQYAANPSKEYEIDELSSNMMRISESNVVIILDKGNNVIFSSIVGDDYQTPIKIDGFAAGKWSSGHLLLGLSTPDEVKKGLFKVNENLTVIASRQITDADNPQLTGGTLIVGRLISDHYLKRLTAEQGINARVVSAAGAGFREGEKIFSGSYAINTDKSGNYTALLAINDISGKPTLAIKATIPQSITGVIKTSNRISVIAEACFMLITLMLMVFVMYQIMGKRLEKLIDHIIGIRHSGVLVKMVQESSGDEIDLLGYEFNQMITRIQRDIELRTQVETELKRSLAELERFADVASHDLQEPLRSVASCLQLLEMQYKDKFDDNGKQLIDYAVQGSRRMKNLLKALLAYSNIGNTELEMSTCNSNQLVKEALSELKKEIDDAGAEIICDELPIIQADSFRLSLLFTNLINNAVKYTVPGRTPVIRISCEKVDKTWRFSVADNGIGIDKAYYTQIFVAFKRLYTQEEHEGSGIGLAICKRIVEQHKGRIWVKSEPGSGSTFFFSIPA